MSEDKKEGKILYISHGGELLIWLIIILLVVAISSIGFIIRVKYSENDYRVFLPDVDGLIIGSPVRMMGVEVGHVINIKPMKNEVYVKFLITNPNVSVPQGTIATVEFSGLAGSKSLELYLPDKDTYIDNTVPLIRVNPPKRLRDALVLLGDMYKKIGSIIYTSSSFGNNLELDLDTKTGPKTDFKGFLKYSDNYLDEMTDKSKEFMRSIEGINKNVGRVQ